MKKNVKKIEGHNPKSKRRGGAQTKYFGCIFEHPAQNYFAYGDVNNALASWQLMPGATVSTLVPCGFSYPSVSTTVFKQD